MSCTEKYIFVEKQQKKGEKIILTIYGHIYRINEPGNKNLSKMTLSTTNGFVSKMIRYKNQPKILASLKGWTHFCTQAVIITQHTLCVPITFSIHNWFGQILHCSQCNNTEFKETLNTDICGSSQLPLDTYKSRVSFSNNLQLSVQIFFYNHTFCNKRFTVTKLTWNIWPKIYAAISFFPKKCQHFQLVV